jgi:hypothetical protein
MKPKPIYVYDPALIATLKADFPDLDIRAPDGSEPPLVMARVDSVQQISLPYSRNGTEPIDPRQLYEVMMIRWTYECMDEEAALSHVAGINGRQDIVHRRLEVGTVVGAYQAGAYDGMLHGRYVTPDIGATLDQLGVPERFARRKTHFALFIVTEEHFVLKTTAAPFEGTSGGARQYFVYGADDRRRYKPCCFGLRK